MDFINQIINFDSSMWILQLLDNHWLIVNLVWGSFVIYAKRSEKTWDDAFVNLIKSLNPLNRSKGMKLFSKKGVDDD